MSDRTAEKVTASTRSGDITVNKAADINAKTHSGSVYLDAADVVEAHTMIGQIDILGFCGTANLSTMSGRIRVHATAGGLVDARTMTGDIQVTATREALKAGLDVWPHTMSGRVSAPR